MTNMMQRFFYYSVKERVLILSYIYIKDSFFDDITFKTHLQEPQSGKFWDQHNYNNWNQSVKKISSLKNTSNEFSEQNYIKMIPKMMGLL